MLYLLYPLNDEIEGYSREDFVKDLVNECEKDIRKCFAVGAVRVSIDFTEGLAPPQIDPTRRINLLLQAALPKRTTLATPGPEQTCCRPLLI